MRGFDADHGTDVAMFADGVLGEPTCCCPIKVECRCHDHDDDAAPGPTLKRCGGSAVSVGAAGAVVADRAERSNARAVGCAPAWAVCDRAREARVWRGRCAKLGV